MKQNRTPSSRPGYETAVQTNDFFDQPKAATRTTSPSDFIDVEQEGSNVQPRLARIKPTRGKLLKPVRGMWKPGASKPKATSPTATTTTPPRRRTTPGHAEEEGEEAGHQHSRASPSSSSKSPSEPLRTKALSGATLNMRFMKRKDAETNSRTTNSRSTAPPSNNGSAPERGMSSSPHRRLGAMSTASTTPKPVSAVASLRFLDMESPPSDTRDVEMTEAMDVDEQRRSHDGEFDDDGDDDKDHGSDTKSPQHRQLFLPTATGATPTGAQVRFEAATPLDMYGPRGNMLGRRSFGKFNPVTEANWNASFRHACGNNSSNDDNGSKRKKAKQRSGREQHERPIGNLDSKVSRSGSNTSRGRSQGKKRKSMISDVS